MEFTDMLSAPPAEGEMPPADMGIMPPAEGEVPPESAEPDINMELAKFEPEDILKYLIDNKLLAPETSLLAPEEGEMESGEAPSFESM